MLIKIMDPEDFKDSLVPKISDLHKHFLKE